MIGGILNLLRTDMADASASTDDLLAPSADDAYDTLQTSLTQAFENFKADAQARKEGVLAEYDLDDVTPLEFEDKEKYYLAAPAAKALAATGKNDAKINRFLGMPSIDQLQSKCKKSGYVFDRFGFIRKLNVCRKETTYKFGGATIELTNDDNGFHDGEVTLQSKERLEKLRKKTNPCAQLFAGDKCGKKICEAVTKKKRRTGC